jgi:hypothetical protein
VPGPRYALGSGFWKLVAVMPQYGTWFTYGGAARIWLAVALLAAAVGLASAGIWLPRPVRGARGGRAIMMAAYLVWVAAMAAFVACFVIYVRQYLRAYHIAFALMLGVFAVWALDGFDYPSAPVPTALNIVAKLLSFAVVLTLFLPQRPPATASTLAV